MNRFRFSDLSLRRKILGGYAVVTILLLLVCAWAIANLYRLGQASEAILQENYRSILAAENMVAALERQDSNVLSLLWGHSGNAQAEFQANAAEFLIWLGRAQDNVTIAEEPAELTAIQSSYSAYLTAVSQLNTLQEQTPEAVPDFYLETVFPLFQQVRDSCNRLGNLVYAADWGGNGRFRPHLWPHPLRPPHPPPQRDGRRHRQNRRRRLRRAPG